MKTNIKNALSFLFTLLVAGSSLHAQAVGQADPVIMDRVVAVVGKYPVLQSDVENQIIDMRRNGMSIPGDPKCYVIEGLLVSKLLLSQAEIDSIEVTDDEVERMVANKLQEFVYRAGSEANLESMTKKSMAEIKKDLMKPQKEQMVSQRMKEEITKGMTITPSEVQKFYKKIPSNEIPLISETLEIREIVIKPEVSDEEITRIQNRLTEFRERIQKGEDFRTLAVLYSDDKSTATRGGELGITPRSMLVPEFAAVAFNLKVNDLSRIVKTEFGYHIMQLIERRGDLINVRHILLTPKPTIEQKLAVRNRLDSIAQAIRENKTTFEDAALRYSQEKETRSNGGLLVNNGGLETSNQQNLNTTWFEPRELPTEVMMALRNLKVGEISQVFETRDNSNQPVYKIISIKSRRPAHKADLKLDYPYLQTAALMDKEQEKLAEWVEKKQKTMFIRIDPDFVNCEFMHPGWIK
jgi:peptidyl-prolyl cis-trans isomerase SurA